VVLATVAACGPAHAFTIDTELTAACHEGITSTALRAIRAEGAFAPPLTPTRDERAFIEDLQFYPAPDLRDLGGAALLASVRDNDLKGRGSDDLSALAEVHGNPDGQMEHCLRSAGQKEPGGSQAAVSDCRAFIRARAALALAGLDAGGTVDPGVRTALSVHLSIRGTIDVSLPTYYVRIGQALHAIEDSFAHTYRTADGRRITVALDWLGPSSGNWLESRDGPAHAKLLDNCDDADAVRARRHALAIEAATAMLRATLGPGSADQKLVAVDAVLDAYLSFAPGCTFDNRWCDAPEVAYRDAAGCGGGGAAPGGGPGADSGVLLGAAGLGLLGLSLRRRRGVRGALGLLALAALLPGPAAAGEDTPPAASHTTEVVAPPVAGAGPTTVQTTTTAQKKTVTVTMDRKAAEAMPPPTVVPVAQPGPADPRATAFGGFVGVGASIERPAAAVSLGARLRASRRWSFGLDVEWNPWIAFNGQPLRAGVINLYGTAMLRFPLSYERFNLRISASLGASYLLSDLFGAPAGSIGIYLGATPLAVEWKLSRIVYLIISPIGIALPLPQLSGVPLLYPQYRTTLGLEFYAG